MKYVYFSNNNMVAVTNLETGDVTQFFSDDQRYTKALSLIKDGDYESVELMNTKVAVARFAGESDYTNVRVVIEDNVGKVIVGDYFEAPLSNVLVKRIVQMVAEGFDPQPMLNFIGNLYQNPSMVAVDELFLFLDQSQLPITEDGHFIAYKIVRNDYMDIFSGTMDNSVGNVLEMPRNQVDDRRENTCSRGLHFCSRGYLPHYGTGRNGGDRCLLVKIHPADVVSIPNDYNNAKGRTWRYEVVGEVEGAWRATLPSQDYTTRSVVDEDGEDFDDWRDDADNFDDECEYETLQDVYEEGYKDGYHAGSKKLLYVSGDDTDLEEYHEGYADGYKDGKNHRAKKFK